MENQNVVISDTISANSNEVQSTAPAPIAKTWVDPLHPERVITKAELLDEAYQVAKRMTHESVELEVKAENSKAQANWTIASKFGACQDRDVYDKAIEGWEDAYIGDVMKAIAEENPTMKNADIRKQAQGTIKSFAQRKSQFMSQLDACFNGGDGAVFFLQNLTGYVRLGSEEFLGFSRAVRDSSVKGKFDFTKYMDENGKLLTENGKLVYEKQGKTFALVYQKPVAITNQSNEEPESTGNARPPEGQTDAPKGELGADTGAQVKAMTNARLDDVISQLDKQGQLVHLKVIRRATDWAKEDFGNVAATVNVHGQNITLNVRALAHALFKALEGQEEIIKPKAPTKTERQQNVQQATVSPMIQDSIEADSTPAPTAPVFNDTVEA